MQLTSLAQSLVTAARGEVPPDLILGDVAGRISFGGRGLTLNQWYVVHCLN